MCSFHFADHPTPSHSTVSVSQIPAFLDDDEFSDFIQGPVEPPKYVPPTSFQSCHPSSKAGQHLSEKAVAQPHPPVQIPVSSILHGPIGQVPYFSAPASQNTQETGNIPYLCWQNWAHQSQIREHNHLLDQCLPIKNYGWRAGNKITKILIKFCSLGWLNVFRSFWYWGWERNGKGTPGYDGNRNMK